MTKRRDITGRARKWANHELERITEPNAKTFERAEELACTRPFVFDMWAATETPKEQSGNYDMNN